NAGRFELLLMDRDRLVVAGGLRVTFSLDRPQRFPFHEPGVAEPERPGRNDELRDRGSRPDDVAGKNTGFAADLAHPPCRRENAVALGIAEQVRPDIGDNLFNDFVLTAFRALPLRQRRLSALETFRDDPGKRPEAMNADATERRPREKI